MKRYFGTFFALTLCLLLFVYVKFLERPEKSDHQTQLYALSRDTIDLIKITEGKKELTLEKKNGSWWLRPQNSRGDAAKINLVLTDLAAPEATLVGDPSSDPAVLGLKPAQKTVLIHTVSGLGKTLEIGRTTPVGGNIFIRLKDHNETYLLPAYKTNFSMDPRQWQEVLEPQTTSTQLRSPSGAGRDNPNRGTNDHR